jgi:hypothetical protein
MARASPDDRRHGMQVERGAENVSVATIYRRPKRLLGPSPHRREGLREAPLFAPVRPAVAPDETTG